MDFRYHIVTLVAVFLALGIGIIIGSALLGNDAIVQQQKELTDRLEGQLEEMRSQNKAVQAKVEELEGNITVQQQFEKQIMPALVTGKLTGKSVAIVETNNYGMRDELLNSLEMAGARVVSITTVLNGLKLTNDKEEIINNLGLQGNDQEVTKQLVTQMVEGIITGEKQAVINTLAQAETLKTIGEYGVSLDGIIIIGGSPDKGLINTKLVDDTMISLFLENGIPVYGVEEANVPFSYMKEYQKFGISTVDNIDTVPGQLALISAMNGKPGNYGVKPTAKRLLPSMESVGGNE